MKTFTFPRIVSLLAMLAMIVSCNDLQTFTPIESPNQDLVSIAQAWYSGKTISLENLRTAEDTKKKRLSPNWKRSKKEKLDDSYSALIVETDSFKLSNDNIGFLRVFIFKEKNEEILDGRIVEFYGKADYINSFRDKLPGQYRKKNISGFEGSIMSYDIDYNYLDGYTFVEGKRTEGQPLISSKSGKTTDPTKGRVLSSLKVQDETGVGCWDMYYDVFQFNCYCITSSYYVGTYCNPETGGGGFPPGGGGGGFGNPASPSSPTGNPGIKNELVDPCLTSVWDLVKNSNFNNKVQEILYDFNRSESLIFTLKEEFDPANPKRVAKTTGSGINTVVTLNTYAMAYSSKEAVLTAIFHEVVHIYLNGCSQLDDHTFMTTNYIEPLAQAVEAWYPNVGHQNALDLAWTGLSATDAWKDITAQERFRVITKQEQFFNFNNLYPNQYGTPC